MSMFAFRGPDKASGGRRDFRRRGQGRGSVLGRGMGGGRF